MTSRTFTVDNSPVTYTVGQIVKVWTGGGGYSTDWHHAKVVGFTATKVQIQFTSGGTRSTVSPRKVRALSEKEVIHIEWMLTAPKVTSVAIQTSRGDVFSLAIRDLVFAVRNDGDPDPLAKLDTLIADLTAVREWMGRKP
jgi:hypothetical protein